MTIADKIQALDIRIGILKSRGETMNNRVINKCLRKKRALEAQL